jgi:hypothetical protein
MTSLAEALRKALPGCAGKLNFESAHDAWEEIRSMRAMNEVHGQPERSIGLNVYECRWCGGLHIGHAERAAGTGKGDRWE